MGVRLMKWLPSHSPSSSEDPSLIQGRSLAAKRLRRSTDVSRLRRREVAGWNRCQQCSDRFGKGLDRRQFKPDGPLSPRGMIRQGLQLP
jgi:hypothetical protein